MGKTSVKEVNEAWKLVFQTPFSKWTSEFFRNKSPQLVNPIYQTKHENLQKVIQRYCPDLDNAEATRRTQEELEFKAATPRIEFEEITTLKNHLANAEATRRTQF